MTIQARSLALAVTARTTDANGVATFYSARSSTTGTVTFCVSGMTLGGYTYQPGTNRESCSSIVK